MNEQLNTQIIKDCYDAFKRGDIPFILGNLASDVEWVSQISSVIPWSGQLRGPAEVGTKFFGEIAANAEIFDFEPLQHIAEGDTVVTVGTFGCRVKATGNTIPSIRFVFVWKLRNGKVYSYEQYQQNGLAEVFAEAPKAVAHA